MVASRATCMCEVQHPMHGERTEKEKDTYLARGCDLQTSAYAAGLNIVVLLLLVLCKVPGTSCGINCPSPL